MKTFFLWRGNLTVISTGKLPSGECQKLYKKFALHTWHSSVRGRQRSTASPEVTRTAGNVPPPSFYLPADPGYYHCQQLPTFYGCGRREIPCHRFCVKPRVRSPPRSNFLLFCPRCSEVFLYEFTFVARPRKTVDYDKLIIIVLLIYI